jgi:ribonuclease HI
MAEYRFRTDGSHLSASKYRKPSTGYGWYLFSSDKPGFTHKKSFSNMPPSTNNQAEWHAVIDVLDYVQAHLPHATSVLIETDSELVVKQISGEYTVKNPSMKALASIFNAQKQSMPGVSIVVKHIPREENEMADALSKLGSLLKR